MYEIETTGGDSFTAPIPHSELGEIAKGREKEKMAPEGHYTVAIHIHAPHSTRCPSLFIPQAASLKGYRIVGGRRVFMTS